MESDEMEEPEGASSLYRHHGGNRDIVQDMHGGETSDSDSDYSSMKQPTLLDQLKNILEQYPNTSILKEMVQNAEDAGAKQMKILYDTRKIPEIPGNKFQKYFKTPALCIYNDAVFTDKDWEGISSIASSVKREDISTVGRFGLGFKSIFHVTDHPVVISGDRLLIIDPFKKTEYVCHTVPFRKMDTKYKDVQKPIKSLFGMFDFTENAVTSQRYNGTIFVFPLRQTASPKLSNQVFDDEAMLNIFGLFKEDAERILLFLKSLGHVSIYEVSNAYDQTFEETFTVQLDVSHHMTGENVDGFHGNLKAMGNTLPKESMHCMYRASATVKQNGDSVSKEWILNHFFKGTNDLTPELCTLSKDKELSYSPFVGVAVPLSREQFVGHTFCFLPLPPKEDNYTGLPVHINGFFALSPDRDHIKWPNPKQAASVEKAHRWNMTLSREVLVEAYVNVLTSMCLTNQPVDDVYNSIPCREDVHVNWSSILDPLYFSLLEKGIFYTENGGGKWLERAEATFSFFAWEPECEKELQNKVETIVVEKLKHYDINIVVLPVHIKNILLNNLGQDSIHTITPDLVQDVVSQSDRYKSFSRLEKIYLMYYMLSDFNFTRLIGLELLPLRNGQFTEFTEGVFGTNTVYMCSNDEAVMFPGIERQLVSTLDIPLFESLSKLASEGSTNMKVLGDDVPQLLRETLEENAEFLENHGRYIYQTRSEKLTSSWLENVWSYIKQTMHVSDVKHLFLVPYRMSSKNPKNIDQLVSLEGLNIVLETSGVQRMSDYLVPALESLSFAVLQRLPNYLLRMSDVMKSIKMPKPDDVCNLMAHISKDNIEQLSNTFNSVCSDAQKNSFRDFLSGVSFKNEHVACLLMRKLEIFPQHNNVTPQTHLVSIDGNPKITCVKDYPVKFPYPVILLNNTSLKSMALSLGAEEIYLSGMVRGTLHFIHDSNIYNESQVQNFMEYFLDNIRKFESDSSIMRLARAISFVPDQHGVLKKPCDLFDPVHPDLLAIFELNIDKLQRNDYCSHSRQEALRILGLKGKNKITTEDIHLVVRTIDKMHSKEKRRDRLERVCGELLKHLESLPVYKMNVVLKGVDDFYWIPFSYTRPSGYPSSLLWYGEQFGQFLCKPKFVLSSVFTNVIGSVHCVIDSSRFPTLARFFKWDKRPSLDLILKQLLTIKQSYDMVQRSKVHTLVNEIYESIDNIEVNIDRLKKCFEDEELILTNYGFHHPRDVLMKDFNDLSMEPHTYSLPNEFLCYAGLFRKLGCKEDLDMEVCSYVICKVDTFHKHCSRTRKEVEKDRRLVISLLRLIVDEELSDTVPDVLIPVCGPKDQLWLQPLTECTYCNSEWLQNYDEDGEDVNFVHPDVDIELAESLGVVSYTKRFMADNDTEELISPWGQEEPLTTRLHNILDEYKDGVSIFKELLQNAEDAGATEVRFLYDERDNLDSKCKLIDDNMAECQGPAFWAYNDAKFREEDFTNIIKLAGRTKEEYKCKIGKFGLGFCAVYNLTDVPSFVSGDSMVIFDPHTTHLGKAITDKRSPGLRMRFSKRNQAMVKRMKNQFKPFNNVFGCTSFSDSNCPAFDGTLFRLPLRTRNQAEKSEIKKLAYDKNEMSQLLRMFTANIGNMLMFPRNVKEISVYHVGKNGNIDTPNLLFRAKKDAVNSSTNDDNDNILQKVQQCVQMALSTNSTPGFSTIENVNIRVDLYNSFVSQQQSLSSKWLISWACGEDASFEQYKRYKEKGEILLPIGSVAIHINTKCNNGQSISFGELFPCGFYNTSHFFCFFPLPEESHLPVHVNGFFAVRKDRTGLTKYNDEEKHFKDSDWNNVLMKDPICIAYINAIVNIPLESKHENYNHHWPSHHETGSITKPLVSAFYQCIVNEGKRPKVFYSLHQRHMLRSIYECWFLENELRHHLEIGEIAFKCFQEFCIDGGVAMDITQQTINSFQMSGVEHELSKRIVTVEQFFGDIFLPNISKIDENSRNKLILYGVQCGNQKIHGLMKQTECIPTLPKGKLRKPCELVDPNSEISKLFFDCDERFPIKNGFRSSDIIGVLKKLGLMVQTLPVALVKDRAHSIRHLEKSNLAQERCKCLLRYMRKVCRENGDMLVELRECLRDIPFLPIMRKPKYWPLRWFGLDAVVNDVKQPTFGTPATMFMPESKYTTGCQHLVLCDMCDTTSFLALNSFLVDFGLNTSKDVSLGDLSEQLLNVGNIEIRDLDTDTREQVKCVCIAVYQEMGEKNITEAELTQLKDVFKNKKVIYDELSKQLILPKNATLQSLHGLDCKPEFCHLEQDFRHKYHKFLVSVGVKEFLLQEDIVNVLSRIREEHCDIALSEKNVMLYINLLHLLWHTLESDVKRSESDVYAPDSKNYLYSSKHLCIDDGYTHLEKEDYMHFVHPHFDTNLQKMMGIKSMRTQHLNHITGVFEYGQTENLVVRLRNILNEYPLDYTILNELLQNADDAGATEIHFVLDRRQHSKEGIFDKSWEPLLGPALCVFNDACFTEKDLEGIKNLGTGSKTMDPTKTGQFGIGFNVVYHLTDVPSFLSKGPQTPNGGTFCAFDPHCLYCPVATKDNPGLIMPNLNHLKDNYPGVYQSYLQKELEKEKGTWFRFPLRNDFMAERSKIKPNQEVLGIEINAMFDHFKGNMLHSLFFLRSVRRITISTILEDKQQLFKEYEVDLKMSDTANNQMCSFFEKSDNNVHSLREGKILLDDRTSHFEEKIEVEVSDNKGTQQNWLVIHTYGVDENTCVPNSLVQAMKEGEIGLTPKGSVALLIADKANYKRQERKKYRAFCLLPLPIETELPVHINGHFALSANRRNVWEDEDNSKIRSIWNIFLMESVIPKAYVSAIEHMKHLKFSSVSSADNRIMPSYCLEAKLQDFFELFPEYKKETAPLFKKFITATFLLISKTQAKLFPFLNPDLKWVALYEDGYRLPTFYNDLSCQFRHYDDHVTSPLGSAGQLKKHEILSRILKELGMRLIDIPAVLLSSINGAMAKYTMNDISGRKKLEAIPNKSVETFVPTVTSSNVIDFLKIDPKETNGGCLIYNVRQNVKETVLKTVDNALLLLEYCSRDKKTFQQCLSGLPLLLRNDNMLLTFNQNEPPFVSELCDLLPGSAYKFVHEKLTHQLSAIVTDGSDTLKRLMIKDFMFLLPETFQEDVLCKDRYVLWDKTDKTLPTKSWIEDFWSFVQNDKNFEKLNTKDKNWCLLPAVWNGQPVLVSIRHKHLILDESSFPNLSSMNRNPLQTLSDVTKSLNLPSPNLRVLTTYMIETLKGLVASGDRPDSVVECLFIHNSSGTQISLQPDKCNQLLHYFTLMMEQNKLTMNAESVQKLKSLPLFTTVTGNVTSLESPSYILQQGIPHDGLQSFATSTRVLLLSSSIRTEQLLVSLGANYLTKRQFYQQLLLPRMSLLHEQYREIHLLYIRDEEMYKKEDFSTVMQMYGIITVGGRLRRCCEFFSPTIPICNAMCTKEELPPGPYRNDEWKPFMKAAGIKTELDINMYVRFAESLARQGIHDTQTESFSKLLVEQLFVHQSENMENICHRIANIKFIVPVILRNTYTTLFPQYCSTERLICFSEAVSRDFKKLIWTTRCLLPDFADPRKSVWVNDKNFIAECLGIQIPRPNDVASHLHNICTVLSKKLIKEGIPSGHWSLNKICDLMRTIYQYLQKHKNATLKQNLICSPLVYIPDHNVFVHPIKLVDDLSKSSEIVPYLLKVPNQFGQFIDLFKFLGTTDTPQIKQYALVLNCIKDKVRNNDMVPKEKDQCKKALIGLEDCINAFCHDEKKIELECTSIDQLFLLDTNGKLIRSTELIFRDKAEQFWRRLENTDNVYFMHEIEIDNMHSYKRKHPFLKLPKTLRPSSLSQIAKEIIISSKDDTTQNRNADHLRNILQSNLFLRVCKNLFSKGIEHVDILNWQTVEENLRQVNIVSVAHLETMVQVRGHLVEPSRKIVDSLLEREDGICTLYCMHEKENMRSWLRQIAYDIEDMLHYCLLGKVRLYEIKHLVDSLDSEESLRSTVFDCEQYKEQEDVLSTDIGGFVPPAHHGLLNNDFLHFDDGEYAAYELFDPQIDEQGVDSPDDNPVFIYVRIIKMLKEGLISMSSTYRVDIGQGEQKIVAGVELYKFVRKEESSTDIEIHTAGRQGAIRLNKDGIFGQILEILCESWKMSESKRHTYTAMKRMLLKWHPDKNPGNDADFCNDVTVYILDVMQQLKDGHLDDIDPRGSNQNPDLQRRYTSYDNWHYGGRNHGTYHSEYEGFSNGVRNRFHRNGSSATGQTRKYVPNPQAREATRWIEQAKFDLCAATSQQQQLDVTPTPSAYNWVCYMCHQACEKACKAYGFNRDSNTVNKNSHRLPAIIWKQDVNEELKTMISEMETLVGSYSGMRYPDVHSYPNIPGNVYTKEQAERACELAENIVDQITDLL